MSDKSGLEFCFAAKNAGRSEVTATLDGLRVHVDVFDVASAKARTAFTKHVRCELAALGVDVSEPDLVKRILDAYLAFQAQRAALEALHGDSAKQQPLEKWEEAVDGAALLDKLAAFYRRFCVLPEGAAETLALWTILTFCFRLFAFSPRLALTSPVKRCGKTTVLGVLEALVADPLAGAVLTGPSIFHAIEIAISDGALGPTILIDEFDLAGATNKELLAVLNAGHRAGGQVPRVKRFYRCFAPLAYALIFDPLRPVLPETLRDRSIEIRMRRKASSASIEPSRMVLVHQEALVLRRQAVRWIEDNAQKLDAVSDAAAMLPLDDREKSNWTPLVAIADCAGGEWPSLAREAACTLSGSRTEEEDAALQLLSHIKAFFDTANIERVQTRELLAYLHELEEGSWAGLTGQLLARRLRPFDVRPRTLRVGSEVTKGYYRAEFEQAWAHYVPTESRHTRFERNSSDANGIEVDNKSDNDAKLDPKEGAA